MKVNLGTMVRGLALDLTLQGYLAHKKKRFARTLQQDYAQGLMVVLGGEALSYERGTPVFKHG